MHEGEIVAMIGPNGAGKSTALNAVKNGTSILLVEQNASEALKIAHRAYVFKIGEIVLEDKSSNLLENEEVKKAFLGG